MPAPSAVPLCPAAMRLLTRLLHQIMVNVSSNRPPVFGSHALVSQCAVAAHLLVPAIQIRVPVRIFRSFQPLTSRANIAIGLRVVLEICFTKDAARRRIIAVGRSQIRHVGSDSPLLTGGEV